MLKAALKQALMDLPGSVQTWLVAHFSLALSGQA